MLLDGGKWHAYRLPKGSHSYDGAHGWNTEWPRIREIGEGDLLMTMHGTFWKFPKTFSAKNSAGIAPRSNYLKVIGDFARWNDRVVFGCDDTAKSEFLNKRKAKGEIAAPQSQSNLWFVEPATIDQARPGHRPRRGLGGRRRESRGAVRSLPLLRLLPPRRPPPKAATSPSPPSMPTARTPAATNSTATSTSSRPPKARFTSTRSRTRRSPSASSKPTRLRCCSSTTTASAGACRRAIPRSTPPARSATAAPPARWPPSATSSTPTAPSTNSRRAMPAASPRSGPSPPTTCGSTITARSAACS
jgi:hypothetical protein